MTAAAPLFAGLDPVTLGYALAVVFVAAFVMFRMRAVSVCDVRILHYGRASAGQTVYEQRIDDYCESCFGRHRTCLVVTLILVGP